MTLDPRWKNPQGKDPEQMWRWAQDIIAELRKGFLEGTWTPVVTFATPGDVTVSYDPQLGIYTKIGRVIVLHCNLFVAPTWTTASGNLRVTGLPFAAAASPSGMFYRGTMRWSGISIANHTEVVPRVAAGESFVAFTACGMGQNGRNVDAADMVSGADVALSFQLTYNT